MIEIQDNRSIQNFSRFVHAGLFAVGPDRLRLALATAVALLSGVFQTALMIILAAMAVLLSGRTSDRIFWIYKTPIHVSVGVLVALSGLLILIILALAVPLARLQASLSCRAFVRLRTRIISAYLNATLTYRNALREGYFQRLIGEYCQHIDIAVQQLGSLCVLGSTLLALLVGAFIISPKIAAILVLAATASVAAVGPLAQRMRKEAAGARETGRDISSECSQTMRLTEEISAFDVGGIVANELTGRTLTAAEAVRKIWYYDALIPTFYQYGILLVILSFVGALALLDPGRHPSFAMLALVLFRGLSYARQMVAGIQKGYISAPFVETAFAEINALEAHRMSPDGLARVRFTGLRLDNVGFAFTPERPMLRNVTLQIEPGEVVGIVGASGGGKSTLCAIIARLIPPTSGSITANGVALSDISPAAWSAVTGVVHQDSKIIFASIADNIRFFRTGYSQIQVEAAARAAHIHDDIMELPKGYDTVVGPGVRGLSGGQRQRLAIARALLGQPQFLVLDEPTSALDQYSELAISQTLRELKGKITIVLVAHRPATLGVCDRVFRIEGGHLAEGIRQRA